MVDNWRQALKNNPDRHFIQYLFEGLAQGFHIGAALHSVQKQHMRSAHDNPQPLDEYLQTELATGRMVGSFQPHQLEEAQVSSFGVIPKASQPGKWHIILDLSSPYRV